MNIRKIRVTAAATLAAGALAASVLPASSATYEGNVPSYQDFKAATFVDLDAQYVVNGDEPVATDGKLRQFYDSMVSDKHTGKKLEGGLIVNRVSGQDDKWSASQALNLTYCVSTKFGSDYSRMVTAMASGAGQWEAATSKVDFVHVPSQDSSCTTRNKSVLFSVEPVNTNSYIARAFFPSSPKSRSARLPSRSNRAAT